MPAALPLAIIGAGVAGAGASLIASNDATSAASNAAAQNNALESQIYQSNVGLETPFIQSGDAAWEEMVPTAVAEIIKAENLFGWRPRREMATV